MDSHSLLGSSLHVVLLRELYVRLQMHIHTKHYVLLNGQHFIEKKGPISYKLRIL